jgi:hypothetical protein
MSRTMLKVAVVLSTVMLQAVDGATVSATITQKDAYVYAVLDDTVSISFETPATELYQFASDAAYKDCNMLGARKVATTSAFSFKASQDVIFGQVPTNVVNSNRAITWENQPSETDLAEEEEVDDIFEDPDATAALKGKGKGCKKMLAVLRFAAVPVTRKSGKENCGKSLRVKICSPPENTKAPTRNGGNEVTKAPVKGGGGKTNAPTKAPVKGGGGKTNAPTKAPVKGGATQAPVKGGATQAPVKGGATQAPVKGGATQAPVNGITKAPVIAGTKAPSIPGAVPTAVPTKAPTIGTDSNGNSTDSKTDDGGGGDGAGMIIGIVGGLVALGGGAFLVRRKMNQKGSANLGGDDDDGLPPMAMLYDEKQVKSDMEDDLSVAYPDSMSSSSPRSSMTSSVTGSIKSKFSGMMGRGTSLGSASARGSIQSSNPTFQSDEASSEVMAAYASEESIDEDSVSTFGGGMSAGGNSSRSGGRSAYSAASSRASRMTGATGRSGSTGYSGMSAGRSGQTSFGGMSAATGRSGQTSYSGMSGGMSAGGSMFSASEGGMSVMSGGTYQSGQTHQSSQSGGSFLSGQSTQSDGRSVRSNRTGMSGRSQGSRSRPTTIDSSLV